MSCFINGSLFTEVLPLCRCWTFLKANESLGLRTYLGSLWTCAECAGGPLCEVFCTGSACTCTESTCFTVISVIAGVEGVAVLKGVSVSGAVGTYWNCTGTVWLFVFSVCHLGSGTHLTYHLVYCLLYHSLC